MSLNKKLLYILIFYSFSYCQLYAKPLAIISLAPSVTENIFEANAQKYLVGIDDASKFPLQTKNIEIISDIRGLYIEKILSLNHKYNLIAFAWKDGTSLRSINKLNQYNIKTVWLNSNSPLDIPNNLNIIAKILNIPVNDILINKINNILNETKNTYQNSKKLTYIYPIWSTPIMILNNDNYPDNLLKYCNMHNVFRNNKTNLLSQETLLQYSSDRILYNDEINNLLPLLKGKKIIKINTDYIVRATSRSVIALPYICKTIR